MLKYVIIIIVVIIIKDVCDKDLAYTVMDAGKSQDLQGEVASSRPRTAGGLAPLWA